MVTEARCATVRVAAFWLASGCAGGSGDGRSRPTLIEADGGSAGAPPDGGQAGADPCAGWGETECLMVVADMGECSYAPRPAGHPCEAYEACPSGEAVCNGNLDAACVCLP